MVCVLGMSKRVGLQRCVCQGDGPFLGGAPRAWLRDCSETTAREIDEEVRRMLDEAFERALAILEEERATLAAVAQALLERETLDRAAFQALLPGPPDGAPAGGRESTQPPQARRLPAPSGTTV
jgi:cell division protease FtsH